MVQDPLAISEGVTDSRSLFTAQQKDPVCQEVLSWFGGDLTLAWPPTLHPDIIFGRLRLLQYDNGVKLFAILVLAHTKAHWGITKLQKQSQISLCGKT